MFICSAGHKVPNRIFPKTSLSMSLAKQPLQVGFFFQHGARKGLFVFDMLQPKQKLQALEHYTALVRLAQESGIKGSELNDMASQVKQARLAAANEHAEFLGCRDERWTPEPIDLVDDDEETDHGCTETTSQHKARVFHASYSQKIAQPSIAAHSAAIAKRQRGPETVARRRLLFLPTGSCDTIDEEDDRIGQGPHMDMSQLDEEEQEDLLVAERSFSSAPRCSPRSYSLPLVLPPTTRQATPPNPDLARTPLQKRLRQVLSRKS